MVCVGGVGAGGGGGGGGTMPKSIILARLSAKFNVHRRADLITQSPQFIGACIIFITKDYSRAAALLRRKGTTSN